MQAFGICRMAGDCLQGVECKFNCNVFIKNSVGKLSVKSASSQIGERDVNAMFLSQIAQRRPLVSFRVRATSFRVTFLTPNNCNIV